MPSARVARQELAGGPKVNVVMRIAAHPYLALVARDLFVNGRAAVGHGAYAAVHSGEAEGPVVFNRKRKVFADIESVAGNQALADAWQAIVACVPCDSAYDPRAARQRAAARRCRVTKGD